MPNKNSKSLGILIVLLSALLFLFSEHVFGAATPSLPSSSDDADIFPFAQDSTSPPSAPSQDPASTTPQIPSLPAVGDQYTEKLYDITDQGVRDPNGNLLPSLPSNPSAPSTPGLPGSTESAETYEEYQASIISNWGGQRAYTQKRLDDLKSSLVDENTKFDAASKKVRHLQKVLDPIQQQMDTLNGEIDLLNQQINESKDKIRTVEFQIADKQISLRDLMTDLQKSEIELNVQKGVVLDYILLVYQEDDRFRSAIGHDSSTLKLLLADNSVSENLLGEEYTTVLEKTGRDVFYGLYQKKLELQDKQKKIQSEQLALDTLNVNLNQERQIMEDNLQAKKDLMVDTQGQEEQYQQLLEQSIQQQLDSAITIQNMKDNIGTIEEKLKSLDDSLDQAKQMASPSVAAPTTGNPALITESTASGSSTTPTSSQPSQEAKADTPVRLHVFSWPVPPDKGISAYFHDPTYPKKWGIHQAIDIRAPQFTEIHAPANGYVFQTKDNGMGYSYIILAHKNKFITVYGHVTQILVKAGTVVKEGDVIGLSGATPGTKGAGYQTTGPHLHFEVWHDGVQVDPLDYLPVEQLPLEFIPDKYLKQLSPVVAQ
jgi:murein DD-endopeptidase MepM/ murein hydrolase activator NlpD